MPGEFKSGGEGQDEQLNLTEVQRKLWDDLRKEDPELASEIEKSQSPLVAALAVYGKLKNQATVQGLEEKPSDLEQADSNLKELKELIESSKTEIEALDENKRLSYFQQKFMTMERILYWPLATKTKSTPETEREIANFREYLGNAGFFETEITPDKTRYDDRRHAIHDSGGLIFQEFPDHPEGVIADVVSPGWQYQEKTIKRAVVKVYVGYTAKK